MIIKRGGDGDEDESMFKMRLHSFSCSTDASEVPMDGGSATVAFQCPNFSSPNGFNMSIAPHFMISPYFLFYLDHLYLIF